jgi:hypothetical protein
MNPAGAPKDLIVLTADKSMKLGMEALLSRPGHLGIRPLSFDVFAHPDNDPGVYGKCHDYLRTLLRRYRFAIAMCDREGCGTEPLPREQIESRIELRLRAHGWSETAAAIVLDPELEAWIWGDWRLVADSIRWAGGGADLRAWLIQEGLLNADQVKPHDPKKALQAAMTRTRIPFSSAIHQHLGAHGAFANCVDPSFLKLLGTLRAWFPLH